MDTLELKNTISQSREEAALIMKKIRDLKELRRTSGKEAKHELDKQLKLLSNRWMKAMEIHKAACDEL
jgi:hypothetical protein